jgi:hypothetical protein
LWRSTPPRSAKSPSSSPPRTMATRMRVAIACAGSLGRTTRVLEPAQAVATPRSCSQRLPLVAYDAARWRGATCDAREPPVHPFAVPLHATPLYDSRKRIDTVAKQGSRRSASQPLGVDPSATRGWLAIAKVVQFHSRFSVKRDHMCGVVVVVVLCGRRLCLAMAQAWRQSAIAISSPAHCRQVAIYTFYRAP